MAKRRNEFITVRHCAGLALGELGFPPVPILKGDKGEPCWPDGAVGSLTHCAGYRGAYQHNTRDSSRVPMLNLAAAQIVFWF